MSEQFNQIAPGSTFYGATMTVPTSANYAKLSLEGQPVVVQDKDYRLSSNSLRSGRNVRCVIARNVSGLTLLPGLGVTWQAAYRFRRFNGYSAVVGGICDGIIDPHIPPSQGVRDGDMCLIFLHGPCLVRPPISSATSSAAIGSTTETAWLEGEMLFSQTGTSTGNTVAGSAADGGGHLAVLTGSAGFLQASSTGFTTGGALATLLPFKVGRVMSANTSRDTAQSRYKLVDLELNFI